jgi:hypothetical protein
MSNVFRRLFYALDQGAGGFNHVRSKFPKQLRMQGIMVARYEREPLGAAAGIL